MKKKYGELCKQCKAEDCNVCRAYVVPTHWFFKDGKVEPKPENAVPKVVIPIKIATKFPPGLWKRELEKQFGGGGSVINHGEPLS